MKPSKLGWRIPDKMTEVNAKVKSLTDKRDDLASIDIPRARLKPDGAAKDFSAPDNLNLTPEGEAIWTPIVTKALDAGQKDKASGCTR